MMKITSWKFKPFLVVLMFCFAFTACSSDDGSISDQDEHTGGKDMVATLSMESGDKIDFGYTFPNMNMLKPTVTHEKGSDRSVLGISGTMGAYGIGIIAVIKEEGEYSYKEGFDEDTKETGVSIILTKEKGGQSEQFAPFPLDDEKLGNARLKITSLTKNKIEATFSATLYGIKSGEKVIIKDGKISSAVFWNEVETE